MATATVSRIYDNATDNNFKGWAQEISVQLAAFGWVKTSDTGQIDWNTVSRPTAANNAVGYEIWRMDDALQSTAPVFLKIEYGSGASSATQPGIWLQLGTATNGAGTLGGTTTTRAQLSSNGNSNIAQVMKFSGAPNRFCCALAPEFNNAASMIAFGIERLHNDAGADVDTGVALFGIANTATKFQAVMPKAGLGAAPAQENVLGAITPQSASSVRGTRFGLYPVFPFLGEMLNPLRNAVVYFNNEITAGLNITATHYGAAQVFYPVGGASGNYSRGTGTDVTNSRIALWME